MDKFTQSLLELDGEYVCINPDCKPDKKDWRYSVFDAVHFYPKGLLGKKDPLRTDPCNGGMLCRYCHDRIHLKTDDPIRGYMFLVKMLDRLKELGRYRWSKVYPLIIGLASKQEWRMK